MYIRVGRISLFFRNLETASALCMQISEKKIVSKFHSSRTISSPVPSQVNVVILFFKKSIYAPMPDFWFRNISPIGVVS